jgi:GT2 family glycosyltransferase
VLAFTDADCVPARDWIESGLRAFAEPDTDLLAGKISAPADARPTAASLIDLTHSYDQERYAAEGHFAGGNFWARREVFDAAGPFAVHLRSGGDSEFGDRATAAGFAIRYAPDVVVVHPPARRARDLARRNFRMGFGNAQMEKPQLTRRLVSRKPYVSKSDMRERLERLGYPPGPVRLASLYVMKNVWVRAPILLGNVAGLLAARRRRTSAPRGGS